MIRHIVMWRLKEEAEGASKEKNAEKLKLILEGLKISIDEIRNVEVGIQITPDSRDAMDVVLICDFDNEEDLMIYSRNPHHKKAVKFIEAVAEKRFYVDYRVDI
ncbi:MAG: Dabb family protein [Bacteroidota bacterium]